jgi:AcrR family transcriptional regulator
MARHMTITDNQILEAAREIFLAQGYSAKTAEIAERAGVSQGSIFKRFPTKEALFFAALEIRYPPPWHSLLDASLDNSDTREQVRVLAVAIIGEFAQMVPRMIAATGKRPPSPSENPMHGMPEPLPVRDIRVLQQFFDRLAAEGRIRPCNTAHLAHTLLGALSQHPLFAVLTGSEMPAQQLRAYAIDLVDMLWAGVRPEDP